MILTYPKLKGRVVEKYGSQENFCEAVGLAKACIDSNAAFRVDLLALIVNNFESLSRDIDLGNA